MSRCVTSATCYASAMLATSIGAALLGAAVAGAAAPEPTCLFAPQVLHRVDAALRALDQAAPLPPVVVSVDAFRREGMTCTRASCVANSCGSTGTVRIDLAPSADDDTPPEELGYRLLLVRGELPPSMRAAVGVPLAAGRVLYLRPGFDELPRLDVELAAVAIDAAGNESAPTDPFRIQFDGCTLAAVGDACEDELAPDADLSRLWELGAGEPAAEEPEAVGASCALGARPAPLGRGIALGLGALGALVARRRKRAATAG